jgi:drug/metabolite transporter (DMT)-like permease
MNKKTLKAYILLGLTACIWGFAFTAQRVGMYYIGPFTFNSLRFLLGGAMLIPLILFRCKKGQESVDSAKPHGNFFIFAVIAAGTCLFIAASLQQAGIFWTTAGNSGFLTGIYVVIVPVLGIFLGKKTGLQTWAGAVLALAGLFFIIGGVNLNTINKGDMLNIISGLFWAGHVILIDSFVQKTNAVKLACGQFIVCGLLSLAAALMNFSGRAGLNFGAEIGSYGFELSMLFHAGLPLLYAGILSVGVGYTLQVIAQRDAPPAHAAIILCTESIFAAIGGILLLGEKPGPRILFGFVLMFAGMLATQWDVIVKHRTSIKKSCSVLVFIPILLLVFSNCASRSKVKGDSGFVIEVPRETTVPAPVQPVINQNISYEDITNVIWQLSQIRISYGKTELDRLAMAANGLADIYILQLTEEGINGKAAPNRYFTTFELRHNHDFRLRPIVGTLMAANINIGGLMENEYYWYLQRTTHWEIVDNGLELYANPSPTEEIVMRYIRQ